MKEKICLVVSNVMTINAFLLEPIKKLCEHYDVYIVVNARSEDISVELDKVTILSTVIERRISLFLDLKALFQLIKIFRQYDFKAIHSVTPKAGLLAMVASFIARTTIRIHIFTGQVWVTRTGFSRWLLKQTDRIISLSATDILVDSISQRQFLLNEKVVSVAKSSVLAAGSISGVDTVRFKPNVKIRAKIRRQLAINDDDMVFLFIGRLNRDKGVLDLALAFANLTATNVHLLVVGPDEAGIRAEMEQLLANCLDKVHFIGFSEHPEEYMAAADCLCLPSYREGFGNVVIEAAAVGIPTIGTRIYGIEDAVVDGQTGLLFNARDSAELASNMMTIASDKGVRETLGNKARERVLAEFTSDTLASAWLDYYQARL